MPDWVQYPYDQSEFSYDGDQLEMIWRDLHRGDRLPFPGSDWVRECLERVPQSAPADFDGDTSALAHGIQDAWRSFHSGDFERACTLAHQSGLLAHACATKARGIYATYLEDDETRQQKCFLAAVEHAEAAINVLPEDPNSHYFRAFNLGRYGQSISILEALKQGMAGRIQESLDTALEIEPQHAEAHTAKGMYHAEIINKVGKLIGGMSYGASTEKALAHFETACELTPESPIAHIEYGNGLYLLFGDKKLDEVTDLYVRATEMRARDAMETLDIKAALAELE